MTVTTAESDQPAADRAELPPPQSLWRHGDFLTFWFGETVSLFGTQVTALALPLTAVSVFDAGPQEVGLLRFLQLVPYPVLGLLFGVWVDRLRRRPLLIAANLTRMVLIGLIPVLHALHHLSMGLLLVLAAAIGSASVLFDVSWMSFVPTVVRDPRLYVEANQKLGVTSSTADVAGPGLAGLLIGVVSAPTALAVDAFSYLASLVTLIRVRTPEPRPAPTGARRRLGAELREGLRWVFGHRVLRPLALIAPLCNFSLVIVWTVFLLHAVRAEHLSPALIGVVFSASSVGGLAGGLLSGRVVKRFPLGRAYAFSMSAIFLGPLLILSAHGPRPVVVAMSTASFFLSYAGLGVAGVIMVSLRQTCTPPSLTGRMNAAFRTMLFGGGALGGLTGGLLVGAVGLHQALVVVAVGSAAVVGLLALSPVSRLRGLPEPAVAPAPAEGRA
ncbi:MFS transporter [Kitasatospora kazusensis]|uniref:MFS transporter n=1 Tax=Kitasatospora kazusensis TaxID=407974 RepID=A0ABN2Z0W4_9ACTN